MATALKVLPLIVGCCCVQLSPAQEDEAFKKWQQTENAKFQQFKDENDRAFFEFLKKEWRGVDLVHGAQRDSIPDPVSLPVYTPLKNQRKPLVVSPKVAPVPLPAPLPVPELPASQRPGAEQQDNFSIDYFGADIQVTMPAALNVRLNGSVDKDAISAYFGSMAGSPYDKTLKNVQRTRQDRKLNDWGYTLLLGAAGEKLYGREAPEKTLFVWFMLLKSEYDARVGFANGQVTLLLPAEGHLYGIPYYTLANNKRYYAVPLDHASRGEQNHLSVYDGTYPGATHCIRFDVSAIPILTNTTVSKSLRFVYDDSMLTVPVKYSTDAVRFFENYPQSDFATYFDGSISAPAEMSLDAALEPMLRGKTEVEAVDILLRFSQTAFGYKVDKEMFGREKPMFLDEVLYYNDSNCKDRAILFAHLVRRLVRLDVVGLSYPGHVATAVEFSSPVPGDRVEFQGNRYVICDPTYIGAEAGMCMPQFKFVSPEVIPLRRPL